MPRFDRCDACPVRDGACWARRKNLPRLCALPAYRDRLAAWGAEGGPETAPHPDAPPGSPVPPPVPYVIDPSVPAIDADAFLTTGRLLADAQALARSLPPDIDLVAAISRSGLLPGSIVAADLHLPMLTVSRQTGVNDPGHGGRMENRTRAEPKHILLIDDTAAHGREMTACLPLVRARYPEAKVTRAVVYCHPQAVGAVDRFAYIYPGQHFLEYNFQNAGHGAGACYDMDGVICRDFTHEECATEEGYRETMRTITPLYLPRRSPVKMIVTARHERHRDLTEAWLARYGVTVERLVMRDWEIDPAKGWNAQIAAWKAGHYIRSGQVLFIESEPEQAEIIAETTGRPVLCPAAGRLIRRPRVRTEPKRKIDPTKRRMQLGEAQKPRAGCVSCAEKAKAMEAAR